MPEAASASKKRFVMPTALAALVIACGTTPNRADSGTGDGGDSGLADSGNTCFISCPALPDGGCDGQCGGGCPDVACQRDDLIDGGPACACLA
jgi:hypothetical protein